MTLHVHPSISEVDDQTKTFSINGEEQSIPTAQSTVRESDSIVYAVSGQIVVDKYVVPVSEQAQPGAHYLEVGMYDPQDMNRLPILDAEGNRLPDDRVLLEPEITVFGE